ncbi:MAG TPA: PH domain-containing protein [Anaerolineales bacterium]
MTDKYLESLLGQNEKLVLTARQHTFILLSAIAAEILVIGLILAGVTALTVMAVPLAAFGYLLLILPVVKGTYDFLNWRQLQYVITNRRVIQLSGIFSKNVTDSSLEKVTDVQMSQSTFGRIFNYGDIEILTASELGANNFRRIANPVRFKTAMLDAKEQMGYGEGPGAGRTSHSDDIPAIIAELDGLRAKGVITEQEFQDKKRDLLKKM